MAMLTLLTVSALLSCLKLALKYCWATSCSGGSRLVLLLGPLPVVELLLPSEEQDVGLVVAAPTARPAASSASAMLECTTNPRA